MSATREPPRPPAHPARRETLAAPPLLRAGLIAFAALHISLAAFMATAPHTFFTAIGPFGARNDHYVRDVSTFYAAIGVALAVSVRRPSWRVPVLAITVLQFALHSVNHLIDVDGARPAWAGWADFLSLLAATILLAVLWRIATHADHGADESVPTAERSTG